MIRPLSFWIGVIWLVSVALAPSVAQNIPSSDRSKKAIARVTEALERDLEKANLRLGAPIYIRIFKVSKELEVWVEADDGIFHLFRLYPVCSYDGRPVSVSEKLGPKQREGDHKAPEGFYYVKPSLLLAKSDFHLALNTGYPNRYDQVNGRTGSFIMVHSYCASDGCIAIGDLVTPEGQNPHQRIEEVWALADAAFRGGQTFFRVHIFPFRMTDENLKKYADPRWSAFWQNLKEGYDFFNTQMRPPNVRVRTRRYVFEKAAD